MTREDYIATLERLLVAGRIIEKKYNELIEKLK